MSEQAASTQGSDAPAVSTPTPEATQQGAPNFSGTKHKVKVDGQEMEVSYEDLVRDYQLKQASHKKLQEASTKEKQATQILNALESGDINFIVEKLGPQKARAVMEDYLIQQLEFENLPEAEKRAIMAERKAQTLEEQMKAEENRKKEQQKAQMLADAQAEIDRDVTEALKELGRKPTPRLVIRVVDEMLARMQAQGKGIGAKDAVKYAQKGILADIKEYLPNLSMEETIEVLGKDLFEKIRKHGIDQVLDKKSQMRVKDNKQPMTKNKQVGFDDYFKNLDKKFGR